MLTVEAGFEIIKAADAATSLHAGIGFDDDKHNKIRTIDVCGTCPGSFAVVCAILDADSTANVDVVACRGRNGCGSDNEALSSAAQAYGTVPQETRFDGVKQTPVIIQA